MNEIFYAQHYMLPKQVMVKPLTSNVLTEENFLELITSCNKHRVYDRLFKNKLNNIPYARNDALELSKWAAVGWNNNDFYIYGIFIENKIIGTIALHHQTKEDEIKNRRMLGYWIDENYPGFMTNILSELKKISARNNIKYLYARVRADNLRSQNVLLRNDFIAKPTNDGNILLVSKLI